MELGMCNKTYDFMFVFACDSNYKLYLYMLV